MTALRYRIRLPLRGTDQSSFEDYPGAMSYTHNGVTPGVLVVDHPQPAVVVCSPIDSNAASDLRDFGEGCSAWLQLSLGGNPALGGTPLLRTLNRSAIELAKPHLELTSADATRLANLCGATYAVVGTLQGDGNACTLTYKVVRCDTGAPIGAPITTTGTTTQLLAALPTVAQRAIKSLRVNAKFAVSPLALPDSPNNLALLGHCFWADTVTPSERQYLARTAATDPLAAAEYFSRQPFTSDRAASIHAQAMMSLMPGNALGYGLIADKYAAALAPLSSDLSQRQIAYPHNYLYSLAAVKLARTLRDSRSEGDASARAVEAAPNNPDAWLTMATTISNAAQAIRHSRYARNLTRAQWDRLSGLYAQYLGCAEQAVKRDPLNGHAWKELAAAATFADQPTEADASFRRALRLGGDMGDIYSWGFQMYDEKWGGSENKLSALVDTAIADSRAKPTDLAHASSSIALPAHTDLRDKLLNVAVARMESSVAAPDATAEDHATLAEFYHAAGRDVPARREFETAIKMDPNDADAHYWYGNLIYNMGAVQEGIAQYKAALAIDPAYPSAYYSLGWADKRLGNLATAKAEMQQEIENNPASNDAYFGLGTVDQGLKENDEAAAAFEKCLSTNPSYTYASRALVNCLDASGRYDEAIQWAREGLTYMNDDPSLLTTIADCYLNKHQPGSTIQISNHILDTTKDAEYIALAHANLGDAYKQQGNMTRARIEWQTGLSGADPELASELRDQLASSAPTSPSTSSQPL